MCMGGLMPGNMSQLLPEALFSKILNPAYRKSRALKKKKKKKVVEEEHDMIYLVLFGSLPYLVSWHEPLLYPVVSDNKRQALLLKWQRPWCQPKPASSHPPRPVTKHVFESGQRWPHLKGYARAFLRRHVLWLRLASSRGADESVLKQLGHRLYPVPPCCTVLCRWRVSISSSRLGPRGHMLRTVEQQSTRGRVTADHGASRPALDRLPADGFSWARNKHPFRPLLVTWIRLSFTIYAVDYKPNWYN